MSTARKVVEREPLKARPKPDANMKELREEISKRCEKTLDYLGR